MMLARLSKVTIGEIWDYVWRALVWGLATIFVASALGLEWDWRLLALCVATTFIDHMVIRRP